MKYYTITVNGNTYEVAVEENNGLATPVTNVAPVAAPKAAPVAPAAPAVAPAPKQAAPAAAPASSGSEGSVKVSAPMPGKILSVKVSVGQAVKQGDVILLLEAMKMENEIVAPQDGTIASIVTSAGQSVEAGDVLVTLN
jgi:biotin carboxyl carrier protein